MEASSWVNLLSLRAQSPETPARKRGLVKVCEYTPVNKVDDSDTFRRDGSNDILKELQTSQQHYQQACHKLEEQAQLIARLMSDNATLISQMESTSRVTNDELSLTSSNHCQEQNLKAKEQTIQGLMAHIHSLRQEFKVLSSKFQSPQHTSGLLEDLERLTHKNADLCSALAATQYSRNILEREIIVLKRTLLNERSKLSTSSSRDHPDILEENTMLKERLLHCHVEKDGLDSSIQSQNERLKSFREANMHLRCQIEKLRQGQLKEIDQRCKEVDALKLQLSDQLNSLQKDHDALSNKLEQMTAERKVLLEKIHTLEEKNHSLLSDRSEELTQQSSALNSRLTSLSSHKEQLELENKALKSQLAYVKRQMEEELYQERSANSDIKQQLKNSNLNLKTAHLELESVRTSNSASKQQLANLAREIEILRTQLKSCSEFNDEMKLLLEQRTCRIQHLEDALHKQNKQLGSSFLTSSSESALNVAQSVTDSEVGIPPSLTIHNCVQVDIQNLKQRLADSRQLNVHLEVQLAQLKTDNAKLFGSYQAIVSIRNQLSEENAKLQSSSKELKSEKILWLKEKEEYRSRVNDISAHTHKLNSNLTIVKNELTQVSELCMKKQDQLDEYRSRVHITDELEGELNELTSQIAVLQSQLDYLHNIMDAEIDNLGALTYECDDDITSQQQQLLDMVESIRICGTVNSTRLCQIEMCDESVVRLQGELEVLRARKAVLLHVSKQEHCDVSSVSHQFGGCSTVARWRHKLKLQRKRTNFVRVKLGYTLSELRLYKQLKDACDQQLGELEGCLKEVQRQYQQCATRLAAAEQQLSMHKTNY